jgi:hypothetical protein
MANSGLNVIKILIESAFNTNEDTAILCLAIAAAAFEKKEESALCLARTIKQIISE